VAAIVRTETQVRLSDRTTLRVGGPATRLVTATCSEEIVSAVSAADEAGEPLLVLGGGSNLVVADEGFRGTVVALASGGIDVVRDSGGRGATVRVSAGESWERVVESAVAEGWVGVEALSGIPGRVGATPIQNVGAYGQEVAETIAAVRTYDRTTATSRTFAARECGFGYRTSRFKQEPDRFVVLDVTFQFPLGDRAAPIRYAELADALGVQAGDRPLAEEVRAAVLGLRRGKGMVLDAADHDTWSAGSFFTNPVLDAGVAARFPATVPRWQQPDGRVKISAAWLIEHAGFAKGYGNGRVRLSYKHTLALTNRGNATTEDLLALARQIRQAVRERFGVVLVNEPVMVGCEF
jgi:UDP-N-acetylmuramate dehydrogenase